MKRSPKTAVRTIAALAALTALAFGFGYLDYLIPLDGIGIPGVKLGLANLAVLAALYWFGAREAIAVSLSRILLFWFVFGNFNALLYSFCGAACSLLVMILVKRSRRLDELGVSVCGAVTHNLGQILAARFLSGTFAIWAYFPVLLLAGTVTGAAIGFLFRLLNRRLASLLPLPRADRASEPPPSDPPPSP